MGKGFRVGSLRGVEIRIDASWLVIALLVTWSYWRQFDDRPEHAGAEAFGMAVAGAALLFTSVLAHELAHALEAKHRGVHVSGITLFLFGGVTNTKFDVRRPVDEFALTAVGPFTSFALAGALGLTATAADAVGWAPLAAVAGLLAWINLALGAFNLLPGAPLDGGRILRAVVWWATDDRRRAMRVAARAGQIVGGLILGLGLAQLFFIPAASLGGLWLVFIGWFLLRAAGAELVGAEVDQALEGRAAGDLVDRRPPVPADGSVMMAIDRFRSEDVDLLPVDHQGTAVGVVGVDDLRGVDRGQRASTLVRDLMRPIDELPSVDVSRPAAETVEHLEDEGIVAVTEGGRIVGLITPPRVETVLRRTRQFDHRTRSGRRV